MCCTHCLLSISREANYCPRCGRALSEELRSAWGENAIETDEAAAELLRAKLEVERAKRRLGEAEQAAATAQRSDGASESTGFGLMIFWLVVLTILLMAWFSGS